MKETAQQRSKVLSTVQIVLENVIGSGHAEKCHDKGKEDRCCFFPPNYGVYHTQILGKWGRCLIVVHSIQTCQSTKS